MCWSNIFLYCSKICSKLHISLHSNIFFWRGRAICLKICPYIGGYLGEYWIEKKVKVIAKRKCKICLSSAADLWFDKMVTFVGNAQREWRWRAGRNWFNLYKTRKHWRFMRRKFFKHNGDWKQELQMFQGLNCTLIISPQYWDVIKS